nr:MAG: hypothetical protein 2 [Hangzhou steitz-like virus 7]
MAFGQLTIGSKTYNSIGTGLYLLSTKQFGQPVDTIKLVPGRKDSRQTTQCGIVSTEEMDLTGTDGVVRRERCTVSVNFSIPNGFTIAIPDSRLADISTLADAAFLTRLSFGDS